jgi:hypothetical protein
MARLTAKARAAIPTSQFAGPGRSFPVPDANHARAALSLVGKSEKAGNVTAMQAAHIRSKAKAKLKKVKMV